VTIWRLAVGALLFLLIGVPLLFPLTTVFTDINAWSVYSEAGRLFSLAKNSILLTGGVLAIAIPLGTLAAGLLYRTDLPFRRQFRFLALLPLFVPLPLFASAWQIVATLGEWAPWGRDLTTAIWIHAIGALPWAILLIGQGMTWVERELEEDALTSVPAWRVFFTITLRRSSAAIGAAAIWIALQTATEITITDLMQVRTFAEEVYTQFVGPDVTAGRGDALTRAVVVNLPFIAGTALLVAWMAARWERRLPARATLLTPPVRFPLGVWRWPLSALCLVLSVVVFALPVYYLVHRAGVSGAIPVWSLHTMLYHVQKVSVAESAFTTRCLLMALAAGLFSMGLAFIACRLSLESKVFRVALLGLIAVAWATPGPIVGLGLTAFILWMLDLTELQLLKELLWYGPSPVPLVWVDLIRFFPCAVAVLWPVMRLEPRELRDAARVDGAGPLREWGYVALPLSWRACGGAVLAVAVLSLGELSGSKMVSMAGMQGYAEELYAQMHYGVTNDLAARCLVMLGLVTFGGALTLAVNRERQGP
jgi:iron(III) transport system permease protein